MILIQTVGVVGAGTMDSGIAQVCAAGRLAVVMVDISDAAVQNGIATIDANLERLVRKERLTAENKEAVLGRITGSNDYGSLLAADLAIEAATSRPERFIGTHFYNPVPVRALLELLRGLRTSRREIMLAFAKTIGKTTIVAGNSPGFAVNRILCPVINEAISHCKRLWPLPKK